MKKIATLAILVSYYLECNNAFSSFSSGFSNKKSGATFNKLDGSSFPPLTDLYPIEADNGFNNDKKGKFSGKSSSGGIGGKKRGATFNRLEGSSFPPLTDLYPIEADNGFNNDKKGKHVKGKKTVLPYDGVPRDASVVGSTTPKEFYDTNDEYRIVNDDRIVDDKHRVKYDKGIDKTDIFGKAGPKGPKGDRGKPGKDGKDGKPGAKGNPGKPGKSHEGKRGPKGKTGPKGTPGKDGYPGKNGENGYNGKKGLPGPSGAPGKDGKQGKTGPKGETGYPGRDGKQGPPGPPGKPKTGKRGPPGPPGPPGNCQCKNRKKSGPKRNVSPVTIDTGIGGNDLFYGGYNDFNTGNIYGGGKGVGKGRGLSGNADYYGYNNYAPKIDDGYLPERYDDGYDPKKNSQYDVFLPNSKQLGVGGYGAGIGGGYGGKNIKSSSKGYNGKNIGVKKTAGLGKKAGYGSGYGSGYGKKKDDKEEKKFAKAKEFETVGDAKIKTETKLKADGYEDELAYAGAEIFEDAAAAEQGFVKGEQFVQEGKEEFAKTSAYGGDAIYQQDDVKTDANVGFMVDHSLKFRNDFVDENHRGKYKGNEFDVNYKATDVEGGYKNNELDRKKKVAAYEGAKANGEAQQVGKFFEDEFDKYGDKDVDLYYKAKGKGTPEGFDPKFGGPSDGPELYSNGDGFDKGKPDLYSRFRGDKSGGDFVSPGSRGKKYGNGNGLYGDAYGPGGYEPNPPYGEKYKVRESAEKDDKYKGFGTNFDAKDSFKERLDTEVFAGAEEQIKEKAAFDKGNYRDVNAKGSNKFASYAGDYQTNNKAQDVDFKVMHEEDLTQNLNQNVNSDIYFAKYNGEDKKFARDAELKSGIYTDAEKKRKQDAFINAKNYRGNDFSNDIKVENEADIYYGLKQEKEKKNELKAKDKGYRGERKKYTPKYKDDGYYYDDYDYYPRRLINNEESNTEIHTELNTLKAQISSLKLFNIMSTKDAIICIIAILFASIFGSLSFITLMKFAGYKAKKINEQNVNLIA